MGDAADPPAAIRLQLDWYPQAEHGGFFQALARGFYAEAGLNVEILAGGPGPRTGVRVISGAADIAVHRSDDIMVYAAQGLPFVMLGAFMQHDPQALLVHADSGIRSFADLEGRTLMAIPGSNWLRYLEKRYGIRFQLVPHSWGLAQFLADPELVQQCFITNEPFLVRQHGVAARTLLIAGSGYDPYRVIFTTRTFLAAHPEAVRAFVEASLRGWQDYLHGDPELAHQMILERNNQLSPELLAFSHTALREHHLVEGDASRGEALGSFTSQRLEEQMRILVELEILNSPPPLEQLAPRAFRREDDAALVAP